MEDFQPLQKVCAVVRALMRGPHEMCLLPIRNRTDTCKVVDMRRSHSIPNALCILKNVALVFACLHTSPIVGSMVRRISLDASAMYLGVVYSLPHCLLIQSRTERLEIIRCRFIQGRTQRTDTRNRNIRFGCLGEDLIYVPHPAAATLVAAMFDRKN